ncbi:uncharacterized protein C6orf118 [Anabas testudineus]|uniref:Translin-associated factor X-interacting protein 1 N-terminal domain-containing protein n=1 Tax=Anabas testudineus TaxID=64144 RepID=A0A3Q1K440_ANATE|nr:uncharacterized protein C6orf118 [Anabas testudineus]
MSSSCKSKPRCFGSDIHRLLLAAEAGQKADIVTYYSGHLGPRSLNQNQPNRDPKQVIWKLSQSQEENPNRLTLPQIQAKTLTYVKKKELNESPSEFTSGAALVESEVSESRQDQATDHSSHAHRGEDLSLPKIVHSPSQSLMGPHKRSNFPSSPKQKKQSYSLNPSDQEGLNIEDQMKTKQKYGRKFIAKQDRWAAINVAEIHERKLHRELKKLSAQSWPHRDRLAVFSDVFDDVCESSPVFGRILREIKTDYDLYVNHMMASQSPLHSMSLKTSLADLGNGKLREMELEDAETEVYRLEQEAREALEETKRLQNELQSVLAVTDPEDHDTKNTFLLGLQDSGTGITDSVQAKRLQVLNMWRENQQLEEEIKEKLVSTAETTATERCIKVVKTEIMTLIASNERLKTINKNLENKINMTLNREKSSKTTRRLLWDQIHCDLLTENFHQQVHNP